MQKEEMKMTKSQQVKYNILKDLMDKFIPDGEKADALISLDELVATLEYQEKRSERLANKIDALSEAFKALIDNI